MPKTFRSLREPEERVGQCSNAALPPPSVSEETLVQRLRARDEHAIHLLYERYYAALHHVALKFVHRIEEAEEVVQQTWMAVLGGIDRFEGRSSFKTWLFRILVNHARSRAKRESRVVPFSDLSEADWRRVQGAAARDPIGLDAELERVVHAAVESLPRVQRQVISFRDIEGWTPEEVCQMMDLSDGNQRVVLHRARMGVRAKLAPYLEAA